MNLLHAAKLGKIIFPYAPRTLMRYSIWLSQINFLSPRVSSAAKSVTLRATSLVNSSCNISISKKYSGSSSSHLNLTSLFSLVQSNFAFCSSPSQLKVKTWSLTETSSANHCVSPLGSLRKLYSILGDDLISYSILNFFFSDIGVYNNRQYDLP